MVRFRHTAARRLKLWHAAVAILVAAGCTGGTPEQLYPVTGTVRLGQQVWDGGGTINFEMTDVGTSGKTYTSRGIIDRDGRFRLTTFGEDGAPAGKHRVWVTPNFSQMPDELGRSNVRLSPIPRKYMMPTLTDLEFEVEAGDNDLDIVVPTKEQQ